jgi:hypothetical protein
MPPPGGIQAWAARVALLYPEICDITLVGSRAWGCNHPESDFDIVICLSSAAYNEKGEEACRLEQWISFDPEVRFEGLDLFFLRPQGELTRWEWPPGDPPAWVMESGERDGLLSGDVLGDFSQFWRDAKHAVRLFPPAAAPVCADNGSHQPKKE